jgi:hypothetical protein
LGPKGGDVEEDGDANETSKSGDIEAKTGGHLGSGIDSGYESDTSKGLRRYRDGCEQTIKKTQLRGQKPSFMQNLALFEAQQAYDERQENKYVNRFAFETMRDTPGNIKKAAVNTARFVRDNPIEATWIAGESAPFTSVPMTIARNGKEVWLGEQTLGLAALDVSLSLGAGIVKGAKVVVGAVKNSVRVGGGAVRLANTADRSVHALDLARSVPTKLSTPGGVIRADAIPAGSNLEYLAPGRVGFDGVEFRAVRDLGHLSETDLVRMSKTGVAPRDINGLPIEGHHHLQQYHRDPGAFVVEIPETSHCISNSIQHPLGTTGGLSEAERADWTRLRRAYYKERAKTELLNRSGLNG